MMPYPAIIKLNKSKNIFEATFPDIPKCMAFGETLPIVISNCQKVLSRWLDHAFENFYAFPAPSVCFQDNVYLIYPELDIEIY